MKKIELYPGLLVKDAEGDVSLVLRHHDKLYGVCFYCNGDEGIVLEIDPDAMTIEGLPITTVYGRVILSFNPDAAFSISSTDRMILWKREEEPKEITWKTDYNTLKTKEDKLKWVESARTEVSNIVDDSDLIDGLIGGLLLSALKLVENDIDKMED